MSSHANKSRADSEASRSRMRLGSRTDSQDWECCADATCAHRRQLDVDRERAPDYPPITKRINSVDQDSATEPTMGDAVSSAISALSPRAEAFDVRLRAEVECGAANVPAGGLQTMLLAMVRRAIDSCAFADPTLPGNLLGHEVVVCVRADSTHLYAHVMDSAADEQECAAFERAPTLELCKCIASSLGGRFWFQHVPFGTGMFASACIPLAVLSRQ